MPFVSQTQNSKGKHRFLTLFWDKKRKHKIAVSQKVVLDKSYLLFFTQEVREGEYHSHHEINYFDKLNYLSINFQMWS